MKRIVFYTRRGQGSGHIVRACAIDHAIKRAGLADKLELILLTDEHAGFLNLWPDPYRLRFLPKPNRFGNARILDEASVQELEPDLLIVDISYMAISDMLNEGRNDYPVWLLLRKVPKCWLKGLVPGSVESIFRIEPFQLNDCSYLHTNFENIAPVVNIWPNDVLSREDARNYISKYLEVNLQSQDKVLLKAVNNIASNSDYAKSRLSAIDEGLNKLAISIKTNNKTVDIFSSGNNPKFLYPMAKYYNGVDYLITPAGYNTFWELAFLLAAQAIQLPQTVLLPLAMSDSHSERIAENGWITGAAQYIKDKWNNQNGADILVSRIAEKWDISIN